MAAIYLVRHGQASFGKANYDKLSDKGEKQAEILGEFWQDTPLSNNIYRGNLLRHRQTLENFYVGHQSTHPEITIEHGFNEFNHMQVLERFDEKWQDPYFMESIDLTNQDANKIFQQEFSDAMRRWVNGEHHDYDESWIEFKARCVNALADAIEKSLASSKEQRSNPEQGDIYIFTSGGAIAVLVQHVLGLTDDMALKLNQRIRNASVTKLLYSQDKLSLDYFNHFSFLSQRGEQWVTYR